MSSTSGNSNSAFGARGIKAPRGAELSCSAWGQEAVLRLRMNSLDEEVNQSSFDAAGETPGLANDAESLAPVLRALRALQSNETLVVRSGEPLQIVRSREAAPRALVYSEAKAREAEALSVEDTQDAPMPAWREMSGAAWVRAGAEQRVSLLFEILSEIGEQHLSPLGLAWESCGAERGSALAGKFILGGGMGKFGGAQPLAATMAGAAFLGVDVDPERIKRLLRSGACDFMVNSLDEALRILKNAVRKGENISVGLVGNCAEVFPELAARGVMPEIVTDLTPAHNLRNYVPAGIEPADAMKLGECDPQNYERHAREAALRQREAMLRLQAMGSFVFDFGNHVWASAVETKPDDARSPAGDLLRAMLAERGPLHCLALSGARADIAAVDELALQMFAGDRRLRQWIESARLRLRFQGLPARVYWLSPAQQVELAVASNRMVTAGRTKAPLALVWDQLDADWRNCADTAAQEEQRALPAWLNALLNASGATLLSIHKTKGGRALVQQMLVVDGTDMAAMRIERVLSRRR